MIENVILFHLIAGYYIHCKLVSVIKTHLMYTVRVVQNMYSLNKVIFNNLRYKRCQIIKATWIHIIDNLTDRTTAKLSLCSIINIRLSCEWCVLHTRPHTVHKAEDNQNYVRSPCRYNMWIEYHALKSIFNIEKCPKHTYSIKSYIPVSWLYMYVILMLHLESIGHL